MKHKCDNDNCKLIEYSKKDKEWYFMETEFGPWMCTIIHCPFCGDYLSSDGTTHETYVE